VSAFSTQQVQRVSMALSEAGYPPSSVDEDSPTWYYYLDCVPPAEVFAKAFDLAGIEHRCVPCLAWQSMPTAPRCSPDCERTGLCA
jgi:hypothetical protein